MSIQSYGAFFGLNERSAVEEASRFVDKHQRESLKEKWREVFSNLPEGASPAEKRKLVLILSFMVHK